jgi:hypothetical protein
MTLNKLIVPCFVGTGCFLIRYSNGHTCRSQWPRGRPLACWDCGFESHRGNGCLSVVSVVCCQVEVSATDWSLVQRNPADCGASLCVIKKPHENAEAKARYRAVKIQPWCVVTPGKQTAASIGDTYEHGTGPRKYITLSDFTGHYRDWFEGTIPWLTWGYITVTDPETLPWLIRRHITVTDPKAH